MPKLENEWGMTIFLSTISLKKNKPWIRAKNIQILAFKILKNRKHPFNRQLIQNPGVRIHSTLLRTLDNVFQKPAKFRQQLGVQQRKKSRRKIRRLRRARRRLSRSGQEWALGDGLQTTYYHQAEMQSGLERRESRPIGRKAPRVRLIGSVHPLLHARSVRLAVALPVLAWLSSVAAVASCCSQHASRPDLKSSRGRLLPRRFLIGSHISGVDEDTLQPASP